MPGPSCGPVEESAYKGAGPRCKVSPTDSSLATDPSGPLSAGGKGKEAGHRHRPQTPQLFLWPVYLLRSPVTRVGSITSLSEFKSKLYHLLVHGLRQVT